MTIDAEDRLSELLHGTTFIPPRDITTDDVRRRAGRQRLRLGSAAAVVAVIVAVAGAVTVGSFGSSSGPIGPGKKVGGPPLGLPKVLGVESNGRIVLVRPNSSAPPETIASADLTQSSPVAASPDIASDPTGGWVITFAATPTEERLGWVATNGLLRPFGPTFGPNQEVVTGLAVSPDGAQVAVAIATHYGAAAARITVLATPFHHATSRSWTMPLPTANLVTSLTWSPDGKELAYIAGDVAAAARGIGGPPSFLDLSAPGSTAPITSPWDASRKESCAFVAVGWLGSQNRFGAIDHCSGTPGEQFQVVDPTTGEAAGPAAKLPGAGGNTDIQAANGTVLVSWSQHTYRVVGSAAQRLPGNLVDAAALGRPLRS